MKIAFLIFPKIPWLDLVSMTEPLQQLEALKLLPGGVSVDYYYLADLPQGLDLLPKAGEVKPIAENSLTGYDLAAVPASPSPEKWIGQIRDLPQVVELKNGSRLEALLSGLKLVEVIAGRPACLKVAAKMGFSNEMVERSLALPRQASLTRHTKETAIDLTLVLDGSGKNEIATGLPFFDHMLTQLAMHGLFDLTLRCKGDLEVDAHHTVEDVALALGKAFDQALGDRKGIVRMASALVPMDESLAQVSLDFSGRPFAVMELAWKDLKVGGLPVSLIQHFLESFATQARCNLNVRLLAGGDDHHHAEAVFKALARALDAATQIDARRWDAVPSSKGVL